jgi:hypothetical protein
MKIHTTSAITDSALDCNALLESVFAFVNAGTTSQSAKADIPVFSAISQTRGLGKRIVVDIEVNEPPSIHQRMVHTSSL